MQRSGVNCFTAMSAATQDSSLAAYVRSLVFSADPSAPRSRGSCFQPHYSLLLKALYYVAGMPHACKRSNINEKCTKKTRVELGFTVQAAEQQICLAAVHDTH